MMKSKRTRIERIPAIPARARIERVRPEVSDEKVKRTSLEVPADLWLRWKVQAATEGVSMRDLVVRLLMSYLERKGVKR